MVVIINVLVCSLSVKILPMLYCVPEGKCTILHEFTGMSGSAVGYLSQSGT